MKLLKTSILSIFILSTILSFSQNEANIWYFGLEAGLDFNSGAPVPLTNSAMTQNEGTSVISNSSGELLFYTNGMSVWNKNHSVMPNGMGLLGGGSSTQSGVIVPIPESENLYYVFSVPAEIGYDGLNYSMVDLSLNGGNGDVTIKNQFLVQPTEEKITAVCHENGSDIWAIIHLWNSSSFYCYLITSEGINTNPVISDVGSYHSGVQGIAHGMMKVSPDGTMVAITVRCFDVVELFDFNNATGIISNPLQLEGPYSHAYGLEFSYDNSRLYVGKYDGGSHIYQYNMLAGSPSEINASRTLIGTVSTAHLGALQLAPDKKIYVSHNDYTWGNDYLSVIHIPNALGLDCNFEEDALYLNGKECVHGLPNFIQSYFSETQDFSYENVCLGDSTHFHISNSSNVTSVLWDFDDPGSGTYNTSTAFNPVHYYSEAGVYNVRLISHFSSNTDTIYHNITIHDAPSINLGNDTVLCMNENITLDPGSGFVEYEWHNASENQTFTTDTSGIFWVSVTNEFGCTDSDTIQLIMSSEINIDLGNDTIICEGDIFIVSAGNEYESYLWNTGSTDSQIQIETSGSYWVTVENEYGCQDSDTIDFTIQPSPNINLGNDTLICNGDELWIDAGIGFTSYSWNTGSTSSQIQIDTSGTFWVEVSNEFGCSIIDTIIIEFYPIAFEDLDLGPDTTICPNDGFYLSTGQEYTYIEWHDGSNDSVYLITEPGTYYVYTENPCSSASDTIVIDIFPQTDISLGVDTNLCVGEFIYLDPGFGFTSYFWQDGSTNQGFYTGESGTYWVEIEDDNACSAADTIILEFMQPQINLGNDTSICSGTGIQLSATNEFNSYLWHDGSSQSFWDVDTCGTYWCQVSDTMNCIGTDTINIMLAFAPNLYLGQDSFLCRGDSMHLTINSNLACDNFEWMDGSTDSVCMVTNGGTYWAISSNICGQSIDSIEITVFDLPYVFLGNDTLIGRDSEIILNAGSGFESYLWDDGSVQQSLTIYEDGDYWVEVFDGKCKNSDSIFIEPINCDLFIPNVFTPDNDGLNDSFFADTSGDIFDFQLTVLNRWGELIWKSDNKEEKWNGKRNNSPAAEGVYFWILVYNCKSYDVQIKKKGNVTLLR